MHPLEPLSAEEIKTAAASVKDAGHLGERGRFSSITLLEPPKDAVLGATAVDREAVALVYDRAQGSAHRAVISLAKSAVTSFEPVPDCQPAYLLEEMAESIELVPADARRYVVPSDVNVIHFFNPFEGPVLEEVVANIRESHGRCPRAIYILYVNNDHFERIAAEEPNGAPESEPGKVKV